MTCLLPSPVPSSPFTGDRERSTSKYPLQLSFAYADLLLEISLFDMLETEIMIIFASIAK